MKKYHFWIIVFIILLTLSVSSTNVWGGETFTEVRFQSVPHGADVRIDGEFIGRTPLVANLEPSVFDVEIDLPGFELWRSTQTTVYGTRTTIIANLTGINLRPLPSKPTLVRWNQIENQVYFVPFEGEVGIENPFILMDIDNDTIAVNPPLPHLLQDSNIRQQLGLSEFDRTSRTLAFLSPTMTYIGFTDPETYTIKIVRKETGDLIVDTGIPVPSNYDIVWSPSEKYALVDGNQEGGAYFVSVGENSETVFLGQFETEGDTSIQVTRIISAPSDGGQVLVLAKQDIPNAEIELWLVDLESQRGSRLPISKPFDAGFTRDGSQIVVAHESGISLVAVNDIAQIELVTDVVASRWGVNDVNLSPTLDYALVFTETEYSPQAWLFKMPEELP